MTGFISIANGDIDQDSPGTQPLFQALRDNPLAIAECDATAPVNQACWHPYDMVFGNDGAIGRFYNGTVVASVTTPTMVAGYDYMFRGIGLSHNSGANQGLNAGGFDTMSGVTISAAGTLNLWFELTAPAIANFPKRAINGVFNTGGGNNSVTVAFTANAAALTTFNFAWTAGSFDAGQLFMYRRRNYMS